MNLSEEKIRAARALMEGCYTHVYLDDAEGSCFQVDTHTADTLSAMFRQWVERRVDALLVFTTLGGTEVTIQASSIAHLIDSSPSSRAVETVLDKAMSDHAAALRRQAGYQDGDSWKEG